MTEERKLLILSIAEILALPRVELKWAIQDLLPEGLTILAGDPKAGKSWLVLDIALSVARGGKVLGNFQCDRGDVLYIALEDNYRRIRDRIEDIMMDDDIDLPLYVAIGSTHDKTRGFPSMTDGGIKAIEKWVERHPSCRLIIIDTLGRFMPPNDKGSNAYTSDYSMFGRLQNFAIERHIAILGVHHTRKQSSSEPFDDISGSRGISGSSDANWLLKRSHGQREGSMLVTGKDITDKTYQAVFNQDAFKWTLNVAEPILELPEVVKELAAEFGTGNKFTCKQIADITNKSPRTARRQAQSLCDEGYLKLLDEKSGRDNLYALTDKVGELYE